MYLSFLDIFILQVIKGAGHHVYADRSEDFNKLMNKYLDSIDKHTDNLKTNDQVLPRSETDADLENFPLTQM